MKLNKLETTIFQQVLNAELDVPVHATLTYEEKVFEIIVVPTIDDEGYFKLNYFNAPEYRPEPTAQEGGTSHLTFSTDEAFGLHPMLEDAWRKRAPVTLKMKPSMSPVLFLRRPIPSIEARVLFADLHHRGSLVLYNNQAILSNSPLKNAQFSISGFTDFQTPEKQWSSISGIDESDRVTLQRVDEELREEGASLSIRPAQHHIVLDTGDGWQITLSREGTLDEEAITHSGIIERVDGTEFSVDELDQVMEGLRYFLAFTKATYCFPSVVIGYDCNGKIAFGEVGKFETARQNPTNWFHHSAEGRWGSTLEDFFPRFWRKWKAHTDELTEVIDCYVTSLAMSRAGILRDSVVKSCAGLEIIAGLLRKVAIRNQPFEGIGDELERYGILNRRLSETGNPVTFRLASELGIEDKSGVKLLFEVRNYIAHPLKKNTTAIKRNFRRLVDSDMFQYADLHDLSQFYLEHLVLAFCGQKLRTYRGLLEMLR